MLSRRLSWITAALGVLLLALSLPAAAAEKPSLELRSVTVKRYKPSGTFAGASTVRLRLCLSTGPGAYISVHEKRSVGGKTKASNRWNDPLGVDLTRVYPRECVPNYLISWAVETRLISGPGTYSVSIRVRDGYGVWTSPVSFSVKAGSS